MSDGLQRAVIEEATMLKWHHAPVHRLIDKGAYIVTCGTLHKVHRLNAPERLTLVQDSLLALAEAFGWLMQAWSILINHYHFVAMSPDNPANLGEFQAQVHRETSRILNEWGGTPGRQVWFQYWDRHITYERSYYARLHYVHQNPVHHGVVPEATLYPWCSAGWFERRASRAFRKMVESFPIDRVKVYDEF
jgi:putative transposase